MKFFYLFISIVLLFSGCAKNKLTEEQISSEKKAVEARVQEFIDAYNTRNIVLAKSLAVQDGFLAFGTDSAEVLKNSSDWETQFKNDFALFEKVSFAKPKVQSIHISENADLASCLSEIPLDAVIQGKSSHSLARIAQAWKKENGKWMLAHSLAQFASQGQSSAESVARMAAEKK